MHSYLSMTFFAAFAYLLPGHPTLSTTFDYFEQRKKLQKKWTQTYSGFILAGPSFLNVWTFGFVVSILFFLQNRCPKRYGIYFGDKFIQIYKWRIAEHDDGKYLSISFRNKRVVQVMDWNGRIHNKRGRSRYHAWNRRWKPGKATGVLFGHNFVQVGRFRLGAVDDHVRDGRKHRHFSVSHTETGQTPVIYRSDGHRPWNGPRTTWGVQGWPVCFGPKPDVWTARIGQCDLASAFLAESTKSWGATCCVFVYTSARQFVPSCSFLPFQFCTFVDLYMHGDGAHLHDVSYFHPFPCFKIFQARDLRRIPGN